MARIVLAFFFSFIFSLTGIAAGDESAERGAHTADSADSAAGGSMDSRPAPDAGLASPRFEPYAIISSVGVPVIRAELGRIAVPESRHSGSSRTIELAFVRIPSTARHPGSPIVWLAGGPGFSAIADLDGPILPLLLELRAQSDVIVLDQRGVGMSTPRLDCRGVIAFPMDQALDRERAVEGLERGARDCAAEWRARGVDLAAYNTRESADDLEDIRRGLGAAKLRLLAGSYGTHLALAAIRAHADRIERAVLVGVVGPDHLRRLPADNDEQLAQIGRLAARDPGLSARVPDLVAAIREIRGRLEARPARVELGNAGGRPVSVTVGTLDFEWFVRGLLSSREQIARLPAACAAMLDGDFRELGSYALVWRSIPVPPAAIFTMRCASAASRDRERRIAEQRRAALLGNATDFAEEGVCRAWGVPALSEDFRSPVSSLVPTLFVSGTLDGDTPQTNAEEVLRGFSRGARLVIEGGAHVLLGIGTADGRAAIARFLEKETLPRGEVRLPALSFDAPASARAGALLAGRRDPLSLTPFGGGMP